jgi:hypothetical protein
MNLARYEKMEIALLFNIVNMKLQDEFKNLEELCRYYNLEMEIFKRKLSDEGYSYNKKKRCFSINCKKELKK